MKQYITLSVIALFVACGTMFITQTCSAAGPGYSPYAVYPYYNGYVPNNYYGYGMQMYVNPAIGAQAPHHPVTPMQARTGYTRNEIRSMPMVSRPSRPGHFIGNTVRRRAGVGY